MQSLFGECSLERKNSSLCHRTRKLANISCGAVNRVVTMTHDARERRRRQRERERAYIPGHLLRRRLGFIEIRSTLPSVLAAAGAGVACCRWKVPACGSLSVEERFGRCSVVELAFCRSGASGKSGKQILAK